ncbi:MAG: 2-hydroxyacyl-CoA dehydratase family protein [Actinomycetota bacterium]|nr:2-hydroxyacyl-CoA dehydratase family protein [Actinomycetota bacterium]
MATDERARHHPALAPFHRAYQRRVDPARAGDGDGTDRPVVVGYVGTDVPLELLDAAGVRAVRVCGDPDAPTELADRELEASLDGMVRSQLQRLIGGGYADLDHLVVSHDRDGSTRLFHTLAAMAYAPPFGLHLVDVPHRGGDAHAAYAAANLATLRELLGQWTGRPVTGAALDDAIVRGERRRLLLQRVRALRVGPRPLLGGVDALAVVGAASTATTDEHTAALDALLMSGGDLPEHGGRRVFVTGSDHDHPAIYAALEAAGAVIVGEDHDWGDGWLADPLPAASDPIAALAERTRAGRPRSPRAPVARRAAHTAERAAACGAGSVVAFLRPGDDGAAWDLGAQRAALGRAGIGLHVVRAGGYRTVDGEAAAAEAVERLGLAPSRRSPAPTVVARPAPAAPGPDRPPRRARPALSASVEALAHQRAWFDDLRRAVANGQPYAVANADTPHELLRAMGIPYVVNQWWASLCAASQHADTHLRHLAAAGHPDDVDAYDALGFASMLATESELPGAVEPGARGAAPAPWGGLPRPALLVAETTTDATSKIFELWGHHLDVPVHLLEATVARLDPPRWFEHMADDWERLIGARRLDLAEAELRDLIASLEDLTGRRFDHDALGEVMVLANEHAEWNARTRDLLATTTPMPVRAADTIAATMLPQWHRGSEWGRDAARRLHDEVASLVADGAAVVGDEQVRLMWVGRGLWFDLGFYERFEATHGAVFVWSMYLAVAADAYLRRGGAPPLRTLAGRFCGFADQYNTPPWSSAWYAKEAWGHRVDGVIHLTDAVRGTHQVSRAIEAAGVPVLEIAGSNVDPRRWDGEAAAAEVSAFIERRVLPGIPAHRAAP